MGRTFKKVSIFYQKDIIKKCLKNLKKCSITWLIHNYFNEVQCPMLHIELILEKHLIAQWLRTTEMNWHWQ